MVAFQNGFSNQILKVAFVDFFAKALVDISYANVLERVSSVYPGIEYVDSVNQSGWHGSEVTLSIFEFCFVENCLQAFVVEFAAGLFGKNSRNGLVYFFFLV